MRSPQHWLAVDWGTSNVRLWLMHGREAVAQSRSGEGMGSLSARDYPRVLRRLAAEAGAAEELPVLVCGMAGARGAWREAGYCDVPCSVAELAGHATPLGEAEGVSRGFILPGLCERAPGREDVMRGEETQIAGLLLERPDFEGVAVLPGTHSKWVRVEGGRVVGFSTAMTGEMFAVLGAHSVLRLTTGGEADAFEQDRGFSEGLAAGLAEPGLLVAALFRARAAALVAGASAGWARGYMSGLLIGCEVAGMAGRIALPGNEVALIGDGGVAGLYARALAEAGSTVAAFSAEAMAVQGLAAAWRHLSGRT